MNSKLSSKFKKILIVWTLHRRDRISKNWFLYAMLDCYYLLSLISMLFPSGNSLPSKSLFPWKRPQLKTSKKVIPLNIFIQKAKPPITFSSTIFWRSPLISRKTCVKLPPAELVARRWSVKKIFLRI